MNKCMMCQKEIISEGLEIGIGGGITAAIPYTICSDQCHSHWQQEDARKTSLELFETVLGKMPDNYRGVKMSDFDDMKIIHARSQKSIAAHEVVKRYCGGDYWNVTLASVNYGNGKTRFGLFILACLVYKGIYRTRDIGSIQDAGYYSALDIVKLLKTETFDSKQYNLKKFYRSRVLMIDDLGQEHEKDSGEIAALLKNREENQRKTIITTNLSPKQLEARYTGRISSRLAKGVFQVIGEDRRLSE